MYVVNKTDRVHTLDIDGKVIHSFTGDDWNNAVYSKTGISELIEAGAIRMKRYNRKFQHLSTQPMVANEPAL